MTPTNRRLTTRLYCEDPDCGCMEPRILEEWTDPLGEVHTEDVWRGTYYADPSPMYEQFAVEELEAAARRHRLEPCEDDPSVWERVL